MAKIKTNKSDYAPGETSIITADGFASGSTLTFNVQHVIDTGYDGIWGTPDDTLGDNTGAGHEPWTITDGGAGDLDGVANGSIQTEWYVNPDDSLNETFLATAQQVETGSDGAFGTVDDVSVGDPATTSFTDAAGTTNKVYQHWSDEDAAWNNNILNDSKSNYFEGEVIPHVFIYKAPSGGWVNGASYSFNITYNYYQANTNAGGFAYITTYNISRTPAPNDATNPYIAPTADSDSFTNNGGMQGNFYTVDANITNVSDVSYTGTGTKDAHVTVTFTYTGSTTDGIAEIYYGLYVANPGQIPDQGLGTTDGANAWSGGSLQTTVDIGGSGATSIQLAPSAIIAGEISGLKFNDLNGDGTHDANGIDDISGTADDEVGLTGWTIFLDKDNDGQLDAGETSTVTGADGAYTFSVTPDADKSDSDNDSYIVREVQQAGWTQTTTHPPSILITAADPTEINVNFGNQQQIRTLHIEKKAVVDGGTADVLGETISYTMKVTNEGNAAIAGVAVTDNFVDNLTPVLNDTEDFNAGDTDQDGLLDKTETWQYTASHIVTQDELDAGTAIVNTATVTGTNATSDDDTASVNVAQNRNYTITKTAVIRDHGNTVDQVGDVIDYKIVLTNTGNTTLTGINLTDKVEKYSSIPLIEHKDTGGLGNNHDSNLDVGEIWTYSTSYQAVAADFINNGGGDGDIDNVATSTTTQIPTAKTATVFEPIKGIAPAGAVLETGTTCDQYLKQYLAGTHTLDLNRADYTVQKGHIGSVAPGAAFYYTGASGDLKADVNGDLTIDITQSKVGSFELLDIITGVNNIKVYQVNDVGTVKGVIDAGDTCTTYNGPVTYTLLNQDGLKGADGVTIKIDGPASSEGTMFIASIKFAPNTVVGDSVTKVQGKYPSTTYSFQTNYNGTPDENNGNGFVIGPKANQSLTLDGVAKDSHVPVLTDAALQHVVNQAINFWAQQGVDAVDLAALRGTHVQIADLGGTQLGLTDAANTVTIDDDAAGYGWFTGAGEVNLQSVDLLSTVVHEFGHVLGYNHDVMDANLAVGERDLPAFNMAAVDDQVELVGVPASQVAYFQ